MKTPSEIAQLCASHKEFNTRLCQDAKFWQRYLTAFLRRGRPVEVGEFEPFDIPDALLVTALPDGSLARPWLGPVPLNFGVLTRVLYRAVNDLRTSMLEEPTNAGKDGVPTAIAIRYRFVPPVLPPDADPLGVEIRPVLAPHRECAPEGPNPVDVWLDVSLRFPDVRGWVDRNRNREYKLDTVSLDFGLSVGPLGGRRDHARNKPSWWSRTQEMYILFATERLVAKPFEISTTYTRLPDYAGSPGLELQTINMLEVDEQLYVFKHLFMQILLLYASNVPGWQLMRYDVPSWQKDPYALSWQLPSYLEPGSHTRVL